MFMKTYFPKEGEISNDWYVMDAEGVVLGRLAARVAMILRGKTKPVFTPHADTGDFVIVVNADKVKLTGSKLLNKTYQKHSNFPGGLRVMNAKTMLEKKPEEVIYQAVKGMLPKNTLGRKILKKLKVYRGSEHPHKAQMPREITMKEVQGA